MKVRFLPGSQIKEKECSVTQVCLNLKPKCLLITSYVRKLKLDDEFILFLFFSGILSQKKINSLKLAEDENEKYNKSLAAIINQYKKDFFKGNNFGYLESKKERVT